MLTLAAFTGAVGWAMSPYSDAGSEAVDPFATAAAQLAPVPAAPLPGNMQLSNSTPAPMGQAASALAPTPLLSDSIVRPPDGSAAMPDFSTKGGYGGLPPYLNSSGTLGTAITSSGPKRTALQEAPVPSAPLGMNDIDITDDLRQRTMMEAGMLAKDMNDNNGGWWATGQTMVGKPNPQQAQIDSRRTPVTSLSKPFYNTYLFDARMPNPDGAFLGVQFDTAQRDEYNQMVRLPERSTGFANRVGAGTAGITGNRDMRPAILSANPFLYTKTPLKNCYMDKAYTPNGAIPITVDFPQEQEGFMVRKAAPTEMGEAPKGAPFTAQEVRGMPVMRAPLLSEVETRVPGGTYAANPNQCDKVGQSMYGETISRQPFASVENRGTARTTESGSAQQFLAPFEQQQNRPVQDLEIVNDVGQPSSVELQRGANASNPYYIQAGYVGR